MKTFLRIISLGSLQPTPQVEELGELERHEEELVEEERWRSLHDDDIEVKRYWNSQITQLEPSRCPLS